MWCGISEIVGGSLVPQMKFLEDTAAVADVLASDFCPTIPIED